MRFREPMCVQEASMLKLYRRHSRNCTAGYEFGSANTYEADELRRRVKRCECSITASGTLSGRKDRRSTGTNDWSQARAWVTLRVSAGTWDIQNASAEAVQIVEADNRSSSHVAISEAIEQY